MSEQIPSNLPFSFLPRFFNVEGQPGEDISLGRVLLGVGIVAGGLFLASKWLTPSRLPPTNLTTSGTSEEEKQKVRAAVVNVMSDNLQEETHFARLDDRQIQVIASEVPQTEDESSLNHQALPPPVTSSTQTNNFSSSPNSPAKKELDIQQKHSQSDSDSEEDQEGSSSASSFTNPLITSPLPSAKSSEMSERQASVLSPPMTRSPQTNNFSSPPNSPAKKEIVVQQKHSQSDSASEEDQESSFSALSFTSPFLIPPSSPVKSSEIHEPPLSPPLTRSIQTKNFSSSPNSPAKKEIVVQQKQIQPDSDSEKDQESSFSASSFTHPFLTPPLSPVKSSEVQEPPLSPPMQKNRQMKNFLSLPNSPAKKELVVQQKQIQSDSDPEEDQESSFSAPSFTHPFLTPPLSPVKSLEMSETQASALSPPITRSSQTKSFSSFPNSPVKKERDVQQKHSQSDSSDSGEDQESSFSASSFTNPFLTPPLSPVKSSEIQEPLHSPAKKERDIQQKHSQSDSDSEEDQESSFSASPLTSPFITPPLSPAKSSETHMGSWTEGIQSHQSPSREHRVIPATTLFPVDDNEGEEGSEE